MPQIDLTKVSPATFPNAEDDVFEFKCSATPHNELKKKLDRASSGFANAGGGCFIYGLDNNGNADGGVADTVGNQDLRDWLDQIIARVTPRPSYDIRLYNDCEGRGTLDAGNVVAAVSIFPSETAPHQAYDKKYYIRAGAHTLPAGHYIVEAIWAMRHFSKPRMTHLVRQRPDYGEVVQIGFVALTEAPAIDVELAMDPLPGSYSQGCCEFPVHIGVIDRNTPFFFDISTREEIRRHSNDEFILKLTYHDLASNSYTYQKTINLFRSMPSLRFFKKDIGDVVQSLDSIKEELVKRSDA